MIEKDHLFEVVSRKLSPPLSDKTLRVPPFGDSILLALLKFL
jgi:hypothetical protein